MPALSVIIPVYNAAPFLQTCLDSLLCQGSDDYEVVLVNDGSTDRSGIICDDYAQRFKNVKVIHQENGGVSKARNQGLEVAKGDFVCFVDADDWVTNDYLPILLSKIDGGKSADICFFSMNIIDEMGQQEKVTLHEVSCRDRTAVEDCIYSLRYGGQRDVFGWTWDKVFRADIIRQHHIRFPERVHFREDELFSFEFCRYINSLHISSRPLYNYRLSEKGLTGQGMRPTDYMPSALSLEESMSYYHNEDIREHLLHTIMSYRALHIFRQCKLCEVKTALKDYEQLTHRLPQSGHSCPVQHLTQYLQKGFFFGYLYCLLRKL